MDKKKLPPLLGLPWAEVKVGEGFFVPGRTTQSLSGTRTRAEQLLKRKFTTRSVTKKKGAGIMVWRIS